MIPIVKIFGKKIVSVDIEGGVTYTVTAYKYRGKLYITDIEEGNQIKSEAIKMAERLDDIIIQKYNLPRKPHNMLDDYR